MKYESTCCGAAVLFLSNDFNEVGKIIGQSGMCAKCHQPCYAIKTEEITKIKQLSHA